jgi:hypothetical protein
VSDDLPYVTHSGKLKLGDEEIDVFRLSNGQTIITEDGLLAFFRFLEKGGREIEIASTPMTPVVSD